MFLSTFDEYTIDDITFFAKSLLHLKQAEQSLKGRIKSQITHFILKICSPLSLHSLSKETLFSPREVLFSIIIIK